MARFDDGTLGFHRTGDNASSLLVPYVVDLLQLVWVDPWFEGLFVLSFFFARDCDCSYEYVVREYYNVFVVVYPLIVVWSSG